METEVDVDADLLKRAELKATAENRTLSDVVEEALRLVVEQKLPPVSAQTGGLQPGVDMTRLSDYQEMEDLEYIERLIFSVSSSMAATTTPPIEDIANKPEPADAPALGESKTPADPARELTDAGAEGTTVPAPPQAPMTRQS